MDEASVNYNLKFIINSSNLVDNSDNISNPKDLDDLLCSDQDIIYKDCKDAIHKNDQVVTEENEEMQAEYIQQNDIINSEHDENDDDFDGKDILENSFGDSDLDDGYLDDQPLEPRLEEINEFNLNSTLKNAANSVNDKDSVANGVADPALIDDADNLNPISNDGGDKDTSPDDGQVNYLRFKSQFRLKSEWERICEKYGKDFEEEADVLDLVSGKVIVDKGCIKNLKVTGIGSTVNEVDLKGVDEAWAQPLVQQKFMESQAQSQPLLSISLESEMMKENDDLISYECRKAVHKDPFESDFDDAMDDGFDDYQDYDQLNGDWCHDDDRYIVDQYHEEIMSSPGVYKSLPKQYGDYEIRSDPIYHDTELEIVDYVDVYEPVFVQPVYYEEYHQVEEYHSGYSAHPVHYDNHSRKQYQERISDRTRDGQAKDSQSQMPKKQISKPKVKIPNNESSEDDLLL